MPLYLPNRARIRVLLANGTTIGEWYELFGKRSYLPLGYNRSRIDIKHKYYIPLYTNLLIIYIILMESRPALPQLRV
jgi:hypothetical protein